MNYQNYFPASYQPMYSPQPIQQSQMVQQVPQMQQPQMVSQPQQMQQSQMVQQPQTMQPTYQPLMLLRVHSEEDARAYPVQFGNSVSFIDEESKYIYTKTMDSSQLDRPKFEKIRLIKEEDVQQEQEQSTKETKNTDYITREEFEQRISEILDSKKTVSNAQRKEKQA